MQKLNSHPSSLRGAVRRRGNPISLPLFSRDCRVAGAPRNDGLIIPWQEPTDLAQKIADNYQGQNWVFLYSGLSKKVKNSRSIIALFEQEKIVCDDFFAAEKIIKNSDKKWFGYLAYEVGNQFEKLPKTKKSFVDLPKIYLVSFGLVLEFDHNSLELVASFDDEKKLKEVLKYRPRPQSKCLLRASIKPNSNFTNKSYLAAISAIKKRIAAGDFYQTNLTRKFFGKFSKKLTHQENFQLFVKLTKISAGNYSSFLKLGENYIISSSPELFLKIEKNGKILSRPIKGTAPRSSDLKQDRKNKLALRKNLKERAENLMIVDLVRNDLARICQAGSVKVKKLFNVTSYQNIHHMSSEISGKIAPNFSALDAIKACFPAGSMTGAPKIKAIEIAAKKEKLNRGVYSGALGFLSKNEINLSVVIRTLIVQGNKFEFQTGGAITFDSKPQDELAEIFSKGQGLAQLLEIDIAN